MSGQANERAFETHVETMLGNVGWWTSMLVARRG